MIHIPSFHEGTTGASSHRRVSHHRVDPWIYRESIPGPSVPPKESPRSIEAILYHTSWKAYTSSTYGVVDFRGECRSIFQSHGLSGLCKDIYLLDAPGASPVTPKYRGPIRKPTKAPQRAPALAAKGLRSAVMAARNGNPGRLTMLSSRLFISSVHVRWEEACSVCPG